MGFYIRKSVRVGPIRFDLNKSGARQMTLAIAKREELEAESGSSEETYLKCRCNNCDVFIEFPARDLGQTVTCPHCGLETVLFQPNAQQNWIVKPRTFKLIAGAASGDLLAAELNPRFTEPARECNS